MRLYLLLALNQNYTQVVGSIPRLPRSLAQPRKHEGVQPGIQRQRPQPFGRIAMLHPGASFRRPFASRPSSLADGRFNTAGAAALAKKHRRGGLRLEVLPVSPQSGDLLSQASVAEQSPQPLAAYGAVPLCLAISKVP